MVEAERIHLALDAGVVHIGENRVQEAAAKAPALRHRPMTLHLIGPLQKNKANKAAELFDWVETVDNLELAARLDRACQRLNKTLPVLVQVNIGNEATKSGVLDREAIDFIGSVGGFPNLSVKGLMAIPPFFDDPEAVRPYFVRLRQLSERIACEKLANVSMAELSMGMSHDFEVAVEEGATLIRVGTAIFGERPA
jgi:hypothetical protein